jgi:molybdenum cofactor guanylyltransferase
VKPLPAAGEVSGVVLAGGRGRRMGGADKGLQQLAGQPLVAHVLARLRPQVGALFISANRHHTDYAVFGHPLLADADATFDGPLAGLCAARQACTTPWLASVPCDTPALPLDLVARLYAAAVGEGRAGAVACTPDGSGGEQVQPTFMLVHAALGEPLRLALGSGHLSAQRFAAEQQLARVHFDDPSAFANLNTAAELAALEQAWTR